MEPRRRYRRFPLRRPPPPPPEPPGYEEVVVEEYGDAPRPPAYPPGAGPPWLRAVWFWLAVLGIVVVAGVILLLATQADDDRNAPASVPTVPGVVGLNRDEAGTRLGNAGYGISLAFEPDSQAPDGQVIRQEPRAGAALERGERVLLIVAGEPP